MRNLLVIAYYFPPSGGPGVQRVLKHIKYIREFGWQPYVLTVENGTFPARDESLLKEIPEDIIVERIKIYEPYDLYRLFTGNKDKAIDVNTIKKEGQKVKLKDKIAEFIRATFFIPDARSLWRINAGKAAMEMVEKYNIDAIYSSSPPYTCSLIARTVKRKTGLPWVAGFRDPWTNFLSTPNRWIIPASIDVAMEKSVFTEADYVECAWQGIIKDALGKYPHLPNEKFKHNPNGFDSEDYPKIAPKNNDKFTMTYTGSMYGKRNPEALFKAIQQLIDSQKIFAENLTLQFIGRFGDEVIQMFETASFRNSIKVIEYLPHKESIKELLLSDALLLIVDESKDSKEIVPGKVYEYMGTYKPLLAIAPTDSAIADLLIETNAGLLAHQTEIDKIADHFLSLYKRWENNDLINLTDRSIINKYERKESAKFLAELLNTLV